jgi:hypothetical protein
MLTFLDNRILLQRNLLAWLNHKHKLNPIVVFRFDNTFLTFGVLPHQPNRSLYFLDSECFSLR